MGSSEECQGGALMKRRRPFTHACEGVGGAQLELPQLSRRADDRHGTADDRDG